MSGSRGLSTYLLLLLLGCSLVGTRVRAQEQAALDQLETRLGLSHLAVGYQPSGTLGFALRDTPVAEQFYRRAEGDQRALLWSAQFVSRWPLTEDQLERWSAQVIGHLADGLGPDVRLAGWERLEAVDLGEQRVAYRYTLTTTNGGGMGEATVVVFAQGEDVGLTGAAAIGTRLPADAASLARLLAAGLSGS